MRHTYIFDFDGTLVDSMWMWKAIDIEYLGKFGISLPATLQKDIEGMSFSETAVYFRLNTPVVLKWERIYYEEGPQALYLQQRGRPRKMNSKKTKKNVNENEDLLEEVQRLRM